MRGPSKKNTAFTKRGLTDSERIYVAQATEQIQEMWKSLYSKNKWKPQEPDKKVKK